MKQIEDGSWILEQGEVWPHYIVSGSVPAATSTTPGASVSTAPPTTPSETIPSDELSAIAYDAHHVPRTYPHRWFFDEREVTWRCNCAIEPLRVSDAALAAFRG